jgi:protein subunit release factor B
MNLGERFNVSPGKVEALLARIRRLGIDPARIDERFVKGGGPGGSKINATANAVLLRYAPLDLAVRCQESRNRSVNRFLALRELVDRIEAIRSPGTSERVRRIERLRRSKGRAARRARARHRGAPQAPAGEET